MGPDGRAALRAPPPPLAPPPSPPPRQLISSKLKTGFCFVYVLQVIEYNRKKAFKPFTDKVSSARRDAAAHEHLYIIGLIYKLIGNSAWGSLIMEKSKFTKTRFVKGYHQLGMLVNSPQFQTYSHLKDDFYEVETKYKLIVENLPIQIGFFILQYAKLRMLQFYNFIMTHCERSRHILCTSDTDSYYISLNSTDIGDIVRPEKKTAFEQMLKGCCDDLLNDNAETRFLCRTCCDKHNTYDQKLPGVFKEEFRGTECLSLCSKTYIARGGKDGDKVSAKGVVKNLVDNIFDKMQSALYQKEQIEVQNAGIRQKDASMYTYTQAKIGFSSFFCKRQVQPDFVSTEPLTICLTPPVLRECAVCHDKTFDAVQADDMYFCIFCSNFIENC